MKPEKGHYFTCNTIHVNTVRRTFKPEREVLSFDFLMLENPKEEKKISVTSIFLVSLKKTSGQNCEISRFILQDTQQWMAGFQFLMCFEIC